VNIYLKVEVCFVAKCIQYKVQQGFILWNFQLRYVYTLLLYQ